MASVFACTSGARPAGRRRCCSTRWRPTATGGTGARHRLSPPETRAPGDWIRHLGEAAVVERKPGVWQYAVDRRVFALARPDAWPLLAGVVCPTLVVRGEGSQIMDRDAWLRVATTV